MAPRHSLSPWIVVVPALMLITPQPALACSDGSTTASFFACLPGFTLVGLHAGFALTILAAFIERPFIARAGVSAGALCFSIQANLISVLLTSAAGLCTFATVHGFNEETLILGWMAAAMAMTTFVEHVFLNRKRGPEVEKLRWGWLIAGNVTSAVVVFLMPFLRALFGTDSYAYIRWIQPTRDLISLVSFVAVTVAFALAFGLAPRVTPVFRDPRRGFDVILRPPSG